MKLGQVLLENKVQPMADNELFAKAHARIARQLELEFEAAMQQHFPTFKLDSGSSSLTTGCLAASGSFTLYGQTFATHFSPSGFSLRTVGNESQSVKIFAEKMHEMIRKELTDEIKKLDPSKESFRRDFLAWQQSAVDRDLEVEIDHVPDKKTVITVKSEDGKLKPIKVKL